MVDKRDYLNEAIRIVEGKTAMIAENAHLHALTQRIAELEGVIREINEGG
jgi:hypothetical protein